MLELRDVSKDYPHSDGFLRLYNGLSFSLGRGDYLAITGGSGWGKSTLQSIILGLESPSNGKIFYDGRDVTRLGFNKRYGKLTVSAVFQKSTSIDHLSVRQNLNLALSLASVPKAEREERIREALHFFGLEDVSEASPAGLSAGQKRRVDLARALSVRPELLFMDEPVGDLDTSTINILLPLLRGLNREHGSTILVTTALPRVASTANHRISLRPPTLRSLETSQRIMQEA